MKTKIYISPKLQQIIGFVILAIGLIGIFVSFSVQKSDVDPNAMMIAFGSIATSIVGIAIVIETPIPKKNETPMKTDNMKRQ
jgi:hypothetical protein